MLARGSRSVRMERHTLILWGLAAAFLVVTDKLIFTPEHFPIGWQRALASNAYIAAVLAAIGVWDYRLTRRARHRRDETLPFAQVQLQKVWWLIVALIVVLDLGMNFFGGGYMFYGIVLALLGLAFYVHGLFSEQMRSWVGLLMIALGLVSVALKVPFAVMEWLAIFVFALGMPGLALLLGRAHDSTARRTLFASLWLALVLAPTVVAAALERAAPAADLPITTIGEYSPTADGTGTDQYVVRLPAGTVVPLRVQLSGDALSVDDEATLPLRLTRDLDVVVKRGRLDKRYRIDGGEWKSILYNFRVRQLEMTATLTPAQGAAASLKVQVSTGN
jgi:hypothetical protein